MSENAVAYCVSGKYLQLTATSIASVVDHYNSTKDLDIIVVADEIAGRDITVIRGIPAAYHKPQIKVFVWAPPTITSHISNYQSDRFPAVTLWRLFLPSYFKQYDRILYLDNDTLVYEDVGKMFGLLKRPNIMAVVRDFYFYIYSAHNDQASQFGVETMKNYFNSGMVLFDTQRFNQHVSDTELLNKINENGYPYLDQTILNIVGAELTQYLPFQYHYQKDDHWLHNWAIPTSPKLAEEIVTARSQIKIRHFVEFEKDSMPWEHVTVWDQCEQDFWHYFDSVKQMSHTLPSKH